MVCIFGLSKYIDVLTIIILYQLGDVAQMVERSLCMREARGSIPRISIMLNFLSFMDFNFCVAILL